MKSKYLVVLAIIAAMLTLGFCAGCAADDGKASGDVEPSKPSESQSAISSNETEAPVATPTPTPAPTPTPEPTPEPVTQLPPLESVTVENNPLLYDFMHRCLGWHTSPPGYYFILHHVTTPGTLYSSTYTTQGQVVFPAVGDAVARAELSDKQLEGYTTILENADEFDIYSEGDWVLLSATPYMKEFAQLDITFTTVEGQSEDNPFVSSGEGWPTEWLRRAPYASAIQEALGMDMSSSWWDTWRYLGVYKFVPSANGMNVGDVFIKCTGIDSFEYHSGADVYTDVHWNEIEDDLYHTGNTIPGIHDPYVGITFTP